MITSSRSAPYAVFCTPPADDKSWHLGDMLPQSTVTAEPKNLNYNTLRKSSMFEHSGIDLQAQYVERPET